MLTKAEIKDVEREIYSPASLRQVNGWADRARARERLTQAAPGLLAACQEAYAHLMRHRFYPGGKEIAILLNEAVRKAEGEGHGRVTG